MGTLEFECGLWDLVCGTLRLYIWTPGLCMWTPWLYVDSSFLYAKMCVGTLCLEDFYGGLVLYKSYNLTNYNNFF